MKKTAWRYNEHLGEILPWAGGEGLLNLSNEAKQFPPSPEALQRVYPHREELWVDPLSIEQSVYRPQFRNIFAPIRSDRMADLPDDDLKEAAQKAYNVYRALDEELQRRNRAKYHIGDTVAFTVTGRVLSVRHTDGAALLEVEVEDAAEEVYELWVRWDETVAVVDF